MGSHEIIQEVVTHSTEETIQVGRDVGRQIKSPVLILLSGELGAGKTTLTKGIVSGAGAAREEDVTSPTFTLVHKYENAKRIFHVDLYRIGDLHDLETLGLEDTLSEPGIVVVEWPDKLTFRTDWPVVKIQLEHVAEDMRKITIRDEAGILTTATTAL